MIKKGGLIIYQDTERKQIKILLGIGLKKYFGLN